MCIAPWLEKKNLETAKCPSIIDWINKLQYIYTMEYYKACVLKGSNILPPHRAKIGLRGVKNTDIPTIKI